VTNTRQAETSETNVGSPDPTATIIARHPPASMYAEVLVDVARVMGEVASSFPEAGTSVMAFAPSDEAVELLAARSSSLGDSELGLLIHRWVAAHEHFQRTLADLHDWDDGDADLVDDQHQYSMVLHTSIARTHQARREVEHLALDIKEHIVRVLDAGLDAGAGS
jgi:hypothetical protein